jgi:hypothetical protein
MLTPDRMYDMPQLDARGYYEAVEHPITGPHRGRLQHPLGDLGTAPIDVVGVVGPAAGDSRPHPVHVRPKLVDRLKFHWFSCFLLQLTTRYEYSIS